MTKLIEEPMFEGVDFDRDLAMYGPALEHREKEYPTRFGGKIPKRVRMLKHVKPDFPFLLAVSKEALRGAEYTAWTNSYGAVCAWIDGEKLGLKPDEFEIIEWMEPKKEV